MKYQVGDRVLILHSNEEADVIDIINDKMMMVDAGGVRFPVYMDQVDFPYYKRFTEKKASPQSKPRQFVDDLRKEKPGAAPRIADGLWLTFLPIMEPDEFGDEVVEQLKAHLVNRTEAVYHFTYQLEYPGRTDFTLTNTIQPFEDFYLHDIPFADLNDNPGFRFEITLPQPRKEKAASFVTTIKLKPKQLFATIERIRKRQEATFSFRLFEQYPEAKQEVDWDLPDTDPGRQRPYDAKAARRYLEPARSVIDLHIEKLTDDWRRLSNFEIMALQLKTFEKYYELAVAHIQPSLIVIHGVGEGRLRDEIHDILRLKKEVKSFINQYDPRFGYGATEILFQY